MTIQATMNAANVITIDEDATTATDRGTDEFTHVFDSPSAANSLFWLFVYVDKDEFDMTNPFLPIDVMYKNDYTFLGQESFRYNFVYHLASVIYYSEPVDTTLIDIAYLATLNKVQLVDTVFNEFDSIFSGNTGPPDFLPLDHDFTYTKNQATSMPLDLKGGTFDSIQCHGLLLPFRLATHAGGYGGIYKLTADFKSMKSYMSVLPKSTVVLRTVPLPESNRIDNNNMGIVY